MLQTPQGKKRIQERNFKQKENIKMEKEKVRGIMERRKEGVTVEEK